MLVKIGSRKYGIYRAIGEAIEFNAIGEGVIELRRGVRVYTLPAYLPDNIRPTSIPQQFFGKGHTYVIWQTSEEIIACPYSGSVPWTLAISHCGEPHLVAIEPPLPYYMGVAENEIVYMPTGPMIDTTPYPIQEMAAIKSISPDAIEVMAILTGKVSRVPLLTTPFKGITCARPLYKIRIEEALEMVEFYDLRRWVSSGGAVRGKQQAVERCETFITRFKETLKWVEGDR